MINPRRVLEEKVNSFAGNAAIVHRVTEIAENTARSLELVKDAGWKLTSYLGEASAVGAFATSIYFIPQGISAISHYLSGDFSREDQKMAMSSMSAFAYLAASILCPEQLVLSAALRLGKGAILSAIAGAGSLVDFYNIIEDKRLYGTSDTEFAFQLSTFLLFLGGNNHHNKTEELVDSAGGRHQVPRTAAEEIGRAPGQWHEPRVMKMSGEGDGVTSDAQALKNYTLNLVDQLTRNPITFDLERYAKIHELALNYSSYPGILTTHDMMLRAFSPIATKMRPYVEQGFFPILKAHDLEVYNAYLLDTPLRVTVTVDQARIVAGKGGLVKLNLSFVNEQGIKIGAGKVSIGVLPTITFKPPKSWSKEDHVGWTSLLSENIEEGGRKRWSISQAEVDQFADLTGDKNIVHMAEWAPKAGLKKPIVHGALIDGLLAGRSFGHRFPSRAVTELSHYLEVGEPFRIYQRKEDNKIFTRWVQVVDLGLENESEVLVAERTVYF